MLRNVAIWWVVFILIGAAMYALRYKDVLSPAYLRMLIQYGPYILLCIHIGLVLMALKDAIFQGILCLLIPCYSFYWLYMICDNFAVRAVVAGLLVGIGLDSLEFYQEVFNKVYNSVSDFINSGGGEVF
jgi:hypothetical protein